MSTPTLAFPPLAAIFLTHFDDIKGQSVLYYKTFDETKLPQGIIEHTSLPSGLHLLEEDFFGFRHAQHTSPSRDAGGSGDKDGRGRGRGAGLPGAGLFRSRIVTSDEGEGKKGRGRRMATVGVVLADGGFDGIFDLRPSLAEVYDRLEVNLAVFSTSDEGREKLARILDGIWDNYKVRSLDHDKSSSSAAAASDEKDVESLRALLDGSRTVSSNHPITFLPALVNILGPQILTVYKAALSGRRILIYSPPPLMPLSAFAWCISAFSLPPTSVSQCSLSTWLGQVGLMDLDGLYSQQGPWVATTSDKILLSHHKVYDLSIDLSGTDRDTPSTSSSHPHAELHSTSPEVPYIRPVTYSFSDIPLYKSLQAIADSSPLPSYNVNTSPSTETPATAAAAADWWLTLYDIVDRLWSLCAGVCEYAVGRGRVGGALSLGLDEGEDGDEDENERLLPPGEDEDEDAEEDEAVRRGRMILRQLHHNTFHLHASLAGLGVRSGGLTLKQVREVTGKWIVKEDEVRLYTDLARRWKVGSEEGGQDHDEI